MRGNGRFSSRKIQPRAVPPDVPSRHGIEVARKTLGYAKVYFTQHALHRMKERGVSQREVFAVLDHPSEKGLRTQPGRHRWRKGRTDVVFKRWPDKLCIITVVVLED